MNKNKFNIGDVVYVVDTEKVDIIKGGICQITDSHGNNFYELNGDSIALSSGYKVMSKYQAGEDMLHLQLSDAKEHICICLTKWQSRILAITETEENNNE